MGTSASSPALLRGGVVGASSASLAMAAHGAAGGGLPAGGSLVTLFIGCTTIGAAVAADRDGGRPHLAVLAAQLCLGQAIGHLILTAASHHAHATSLTAPMLAAHVAAALLCALLIGLADHLYRVSVSVLSRLAAIANPAPTGPMRLRASTTCLAVLRPRYLDSGHGTRGPPVGVVST